MTSESTSDFILPDAPAPDRDARHRAIATALNKFDDVRTSNHAAAASRPVTPRRQTDRPRAFRSPVPQLIAASFAVAVAWPVVSAITSSGTPMQDAPKQTAAPPSEVALPQVEMQRQREAAADVRVPEAKIAAAPPPPPMPVPQPQQLAALPKASAPQPSRARALSFAAQDASAPRDQVSSAREEVGRDKFTSVTKNGFMSPKDAPRSTFSIDVDTASYSFVRASLAKNMLPQPAAVRIEELVNYFPYDYPSPPSASEPFSVTSAVFPSPWAKDTKIIRVGIKGYAIKKEARPNANLVFLIDTSGSMASANRLPLVKQSLEMLVKQLAPNDRVAIVSYAGNSDVALEPTPTSDAGKILAAVDRLHAGGGTAGGEGIREAYALASRNFDPKAINRVILATDGDFNIGITDQAELTGFIERQRAAGIFLSILGFGMGNYNDALMQSLAQNGNGVAAYIDTINEARKVLVDEMTGTLFPIAKDVKIQVEFNPAAVAEYRLIGYETRAMHERDFNNDKVDAGDVGSGQSVTALYEIVPAGGQETVDALRYQKAAKADASSAASEYAFVKIRYKLPSSDRSELISTPINRAAEHATFAAAPTDARFATAVAAFGELLQGGRYTGSLSYESVADLARAARGDDPFGYRSEFVQLVRAADLATEVRSKRQ